MSGIYDAYNGTVYAGKARTEVIIGIVMIEAIEKVLISKLKLDK